MRFFAPHTLHSKPRLIVARDLSPAPIFGLFTGYAAICGQNLRNSIFIIVAALVLLFTANVHAAAYDPSAKWKTIETKHFRVHHPERIGEVAKRAAVILEEIYPDVTAKWRWKPWSYTEVVLNDNTDESNGLSSVLPYNWMLIYVAPPTPDSSLAHYDNWLRMLLIHEYTHIVQMDAYGGAWIPFHVLLGKTIAPSGVNPTWIREGVAQYDETIFTTGGRGRGSFSEMVVRTAVLTKTFPPIDTADGLGWRWPGYKTAYIYGIKFLQWLTEKYGEEKFLEFDRRVRSSILLTMINHQAKRVYGKTFYKLWKEWQEDLAGRYEKELAQIEAVGLSEPQPIVRNGDDQQLFVPTLSPDGKRLAYVSSSPHRKTEMRVMDMQSGETKVIRKGQDATQLSWNSEGTKLAYSSIGSKKRFYRYYDLWLYDFEARGGKGKVSALTNGMRARDPDFDPSGKSVVFVQSDKGTDELRIMEIESKEARTVASGEENFIQFANPRFSPDGKHIAVSVWKPAHGWRVYRYDADGKNPIRLTKGEGPALSEVEGLVIESRPVWSDGGKTVFFASDESGIGNIYKVSAGGGDVVMVTNVLTGVFQPVVAGGGEIIAQNYTAKGFEIARFTTSVIARSPSASLRAGANSEAIPSQDFTPRKYVAFGKSLFLPRYVLPGAAYVGDTFFASLFTGGGDPLWWHTWTGGATYRTDANFFGYSLQYTYNRFIPVFGLLASEYAVNFGDFADIVNKIDDTYYYQGAFHLFEKRRALAAYAGYSYRRNAFNLAYVFEDHQSLRSLSALNNEFYNFNFGHFGGFRFEYRYGDAERFPASISQENGRNIRLTTHVTDEVFGSSPRNEQVIFSGDWREYIRLVGHSVFALRASGGMTWGDRLVQGTFGLGGALGEGSFGGAGSFNYFPMRGLPVSAFSGTRAMLFSGELRLPILDPLRGIGTIPVFLKDISGALFADYGNTWYAHDPGSDSFKDFFDRFLLGVGAELRGDFVVGHGLLIHGRAGYAIIVLNRGRLGGLTDPIIRDSIRNGMIVLALGTSF